MEPPHRYLREPSASLAHHADYLNRRENQTLCGASIENATSPADVAEVCPECEAKLVLYHLDWWREKALAASAELVELRAKYGEPTEPPADLNPAAPADSADSAAATADEQPTTLLDQARRELTKLCREFDGAVPYFRLKNAMQSFSDGLESDQRVLLAQEIGGDGTLIRWSTMEVESLGWHVSNSPVQGDSEANWDAWVQETYQAPRKSKRRFGRAR